MRSSVITGVCRHGISGYEKVGLVQADGVRRDLSIVVTELDAAFFSTEWWTALETVNLTRLPPVAMETRIAPCLERPPIFALARGRGNLSVAILSSESLGGADDPIITSGAMLQCLAGVAVIAGAPSVDGALRAAGYCSFLLATAEGDGFPAESGALLLGPIVVGPAAELPAALSLRFTSGTVVIEHEIGVAVKSVRPALRSITVHHRIPGTTILLAAVDSATFPAAAGSVIRLDAGPLGVQVHALAAAAA